MADFSYELPVRYADTDAQGHVFFANYLTYFDEGLTYFLEALGCSYASLETEGVEFVFVESHCQHKGSAKFGERLRVEVRVEKLGRTSMTTAYVLRRGDAVLASGHLVSVCLDKETMASCALPTRLREAVAAFEA